MGARKFIPTELAELLRSDWEILIREAALFQQDEMIVRRCLVDKWPLIDAAIEIGIDRGTVSARLSYLIPRLQAVFEKLHRADQL